MRAALDASVTLRVIKLSASKEKHAEAVDDECVTFEISDEHLLVQLSTGNMEALAVLFRRYGRMVHGISRKILRNEAEADDFLQDLFLSVRTESVKFNPVRGSAKTWILQLAYRRAISRRRYLTSRHFYTRIDPEDAATELADEEKGRFEDSIDGMLGRGSLQRVFDSLSEDQRQTLQLHFVEGYSFDEIAGKLRQSRGNVKHHYFRGLEKLRKELLGSKLASERSR